MSAGPGTGRVVTSSSGRRLPPSSLSALCIGIWLAGAHQDAEAKTLVVYGTSEATFRVDEKFPVEVRPYHGAGFDQVVELAGAAKLARLRSSPGTLGLDATHPLASGGPFLAPIEPLPDAARAEVVRLGSTSTTRRQVVDGVLDWLEERITIAAGVGPSQAPADVLARGNANCVGLTRMAIAMLRTADIPARSLHGFRLQLQDGRVVGGAFHRALEVFYPGAGWVASDIGRTRNYLPPDFLVLAFEGEKLSPADTLVEARPAEPYHANIDCRSQDSELLTLDERPWPKERTLLAAWTIGHKLSRGAIVGTLVASPPDARLVAESARGRFTATRAGPLFAFSGLLPGSYTILVQTNRGEARSGPWRLEERQLMQLTLDLGALKEDGTRQ